jgi:hypothetical protein
MQQPHRPYLAVCVIKSYVLWDASEKDPFGNADSQAFLAPANPSRRLPLLAPNAYRYPAAAFTPAARNGSWLTVFGGAHRSRFCQAFARVGPARWSKSAGHANSAATHASLAGRRTRSAAGAKETSPHRFLFRGFSHRGTQLHWG